MARIVQLSDIHFGGENPVAVAAAADFVRTTPFDLLVVTGDITAYGSREEFKAADIWFRSLPGPQLFTPGNHDTPWAGVADRLFYPFGRYADHFGASEAEGFAHGDMVVRSLNTARGIQARLNWSKGAIGRGQVRRALAGLDDRPGALRVIACHHPLIEVVGGPMTGRVHGGRRAARAFAEAGVDMILTGHLHAPFALALPFADARTYAIGCGTLSLRERGFAPSFNVIETDAGAIQVTAMGWKGAHFEAERTWSLDRRPPIAATAATPPRPATPGP